MAAQLDKWRLHLFGINYLSVAVGTAAAGSMYLPFSLIVLLHIFVCSHYLVFFPGKQRLRIKGQSRKKVYSRILIND